MLLKKCLILTNLQLFLVAKWMQLQKKSKIFAANSVAGLVVTGLGFTSFFTRRLAVYKLLCCAEVYQFIVLHLKTNATFAMF